MERGGKGKKYLKRETSSVLGMGSFLKNEVDRICGLVQKEGILSSSPLWKVDQMAIAEGILH
jgi:hypothetical protein